MTRHRIPLVVLVLAAAFGAHPAAQSIFAVPQLTVQQLGEGERPRIDGRVDDGPWSTTEPFSAFVQQEDRKSVV